MSFYKKDFGPNTLFLSKHNASKSPIAIAHFYPKSVKNEISIIYKLVARTTSLFIPLSVLQSATIKGYGLIVKLTFLYFFFIYCHRSIYVPISMTAAIDTLNYYNGP